MGGSMHIFLKSIVLWRSRNCRRTNRGAGLAFADKYFETGGVTMTYFVMAQHVKVLYTKLYMAMLWKLRLFYCGEQWLRDGNISRKNG
jgi:pyruvate dehydrogenase E1 component alpha subunit